MRGTILKGKTGYDQYTAPLTAVVEPPGGGGNSVYENGGDARRLA